MLNKFYILLLALVVAVPAAASAKTLPAPVMVQEKTSCVECGMLIKGAGLRFASEIILDDGKVKYFCDLGDLFVFYYVHHKKESIAAIYVKDYLSGEWVEGREAAYLSGVKVITPMRYGILAFKDVKAAEKFQEERGGDKIYGFEEILSSKIFKR
jgi:copper chaperone NosL